MGLNLISKASSGTAVYNPDNNNMVWTIKQFPGQREITMEGTFSLPSIASRIILIFWERFINIFPKLKETTFIKSLFL